MSKWEEKLAELGITEADTSGGTKKKIKEYRGHVEGLEELEAIINDENASARKRTNAKKQYDEIKEYVDGLDFEIAKNIALYHKNKDKYTEAINKAHTARGIKKSDNQPVETKVEAVSGVVVEQPATPQAAPTQGSEGVSVPKEKKTGTGTYILLGGLLLVLSLGAVNYFNKD